MESGDLAAAVAEDRLTWDRVIEFTDVVCGRVSGRANAAEITLFESHGLSAWDIVTAARVYDLARARGLGRDLPLWAGRQPAD